MNLKPGEKLCRHCYKHVAHNDSLNTEGMLEDLDVSFYDYMLDTKKSSSDAEASGVSPIKKISFRDKISMVETN